MTFEQPGEIVIKTWQLVLLLVGALLVGIEVGHWVFLVLWEVLK